MIYENELIDIAEEIEQIDMDTFDTLSAIDQDKAMKISQCLGDAAWAIRELADGLESDLIEI